MDSEEWRPVQGYPRYSVSSWGRLKGPRGHVLSPKITPRGYAIYGVFQDGKIYHRPVHRLVCEAFHGPAPEGKPLALHGVNGVSDNSAVNVRWGSNSENMRDRRRDGTDYKVNRTHCPRNHPYHGDNLGVNKWGHRFCKTCRRDRAKRVSSEGLTAKDSRHGTTNGYNQFGCRCGPCKEAYSNYYRGRKYGA